MPFEKKDADGEDLKPTVDDANHVKRAAYIDFFKKPFKNLLILSGAGSSIDVGGPYNVYSLGKGSKTISKRRH